MQWFIHQLSNGIFFDFLLFRYQDIALSSSYRGKLNKFSKVEAGQKRISEWRYHLQEQHHQDCVSYDRRHQLTQEERAEENPFTPYLAKEKRKLGELCARLMHTVYGDAKRGTLSVSLKVEKQCLCFQLIDKLNSLIHRLLAYLLNLFTDWFTEVIAWRIYSINWLIYLFIDWLIYRSIDWFVHWSIDRQFNCLAN